MKISIAVSYPNGAVATICIPLAENANVSVSTLPKQEGGLETAKESQQSAGRVWSRESAIIAKSIDELLATGEKEEGEGKGRIGGVGERKEDGEKGKPEQSEAFNFEFPCKGGKYSPPAQLVKNHIATYGEQMVLEEYREAQNWLITNPQKIKTETGTGKYLSGWLRRSRKFREEQASKMAAMAPRKQNDNLLANANQTTEGW